MLNTNFNSLGTSFYPIGMGTPNNHVNQGGYVTWKGNGVNSNPVGIAPGHIRPLTNNDPGNVFPSPFGKARPIKHYRKGRTIPNVTPIIESNTNSIVINNITITAQAEANLIAYNLNRQVKSSLGTPLGQGRDGGGLLSEMIDKPGAYTIKENRVLQANENLKSDLDCKTCQGVSIVDTYYPNKFYLTENPEKNVQNPILCCNEQRKALRRVIYANTNLPNNYYTTHFQYLQNRCQTYNQKVFNFKKNTLDESIIIKNSNNPLITVAAIETAKPGSALAATNTYVANCQPNFEIYQASEISIVYTALELLLKYGDITQTQYDNFISEAKINLNNLYLYLKKLPTTQSIKAISLFKRFINNPYYGLPLSGPNNPLGCKLTVYKPSNHQFAVEGAVESSTRTLKLNVTTIETNAASYYTNSAGQIISKNNIANLVPNNVPFLLKNKVPNCNNPNILPFQNKKACYYNKLKNYYTPNSQQSPYRYYPGIVFSSNHFAQSPKVGLYTSTIAGSAPF
jgi:hypothetical protein